MAFFTTEGLEDIKLERDLYKKLLELGAQNDPEPFLAEALGFIVQSTRAKRGYLALFREDSNTPQWWLSKGFSDEELKLVRQKISNGIIAEAMASASPIQTESAQSDPRFQDHQSVQQNRIEAVLCVPIGEAQPIGVLYLQDRLQPGAFSIEERERAVFFARHIAPYAERLLLKAKTEAQDLTAVFRQRLKISGLVGKSQALADAISQLEGAARFVVPVLLVGPSGTGKTAFAKAIHENSLRADKPFIELNCAAIPESLFESELFGALPGAHSTATKKMLGKIAAAEGGTLFLDEIGELPLGLQSKLLQFLQSKEYFPLGATKAEKANVRIITATNLNLEQAALQKTFREDLFYRLNVLSIRLPSLAERRGDIAVLAEHFCKSACRTNDLPLLSLSPGALRAVEEAEWPGNVRQLSHVVEAATLRATMEEAKELSRKHLFPNSELNPPEEEQKTQLTLQEASRRFQKKFLQEVLTATQWNISETARRLDVSRTYVRSLIQAHGLK